MLHQFWLKLLFWTKWRENWLIQFCPPTKCMLRWRVTAPCVCAVEEACLMETEDTRSRKHSRRTLQDEHGQYPVWMNQRAIRKRKTAAAAVRRRAKVKSGSRKKLRKWQDVYCERRSTYMSEMCVKAMLHLADTFAPYHDVICECQRTFFFSLKYSAEKQVYDFQLFLPLFPDFSY